MNLSNIVEANYTMSKIEEIKRLFKQWSKRKITPTGEKSCHKNLSVTKNKTPYYQEIVDIQNTLFRYKWSSGPNKI